VRNKSSNDRKIEEAQQKHYQVCLQERNARLSKQPPSSSVPHAPGDHPKRSSNPPPGFCPLPVVAPVPQIPAVAFSFAIACRLDVWFWVGVDFFNPELAWFQMLPNASFFLFWAPNDDAAVEEAFVDHQHDLIE